MSSLWTPGGERPVGGDGGERGPEQGPPGPQPAPPGDPLDHLGADLSDEQRAALEQELRSAQEQLRSTPAEVVVANHAIGLFQLAAIHLAGDEPDLDAARLAIDGMAGVVEGLGERLGDHLEPLTEALTQIRIAWVQLSDDRGQRT